MSITATRYHDISCGHRVVGHEGKCRYLHGHNYRVHFTCQIDREDWEQYVPSEEKGEDLDHVGRVIDFSAMKSKLCIWLEENYDHKFLAWEQDDALRTIVMDRLMGEEGTETDSLLRESIVIVPFNPTAENIAKYLLEVIGPMQLEGTGVRLIKVVVEETRKCSASAEIE